MEWDSGLDSFNNEFIKSSAHAEKLKLEKQKLVDDLQESRSTLKKTNEHLKLVDKDRKIQVAEAAELRKIIETIKVDAPQGSKLLIERLERKLAKWEEYYKAVNAVTKEHPWIHRLIQYIYSEFIAVNSLPVADAVKTATHWSACQSKEKRGLAIV